MSHEPGRYVMSDRLRDWLARRPPDRQLAARGAPPPCVDCPKHVIRAQRTDEEVLNRLTKAERDDVQAREADLP